MQDLLQIFTKSFFLLFVVSFIVANARPSSQIGESNQLLPDQEPNNFIDSGLKPWQMEVLAQRLAALNQIGGGDYGFERSLRSGNEIKRQSRLRLCYFNPVSCFKK